jgi:hypothetical protein
VAQSILGPACALVELAPPGVTPPEDDREFIVAAWCLHPTLVPKEKTIFIREPNVRILGHALYVDADEIILNRLPGLHSHVCLRIVEYQDWSTPPPSSDDEDTTRMIATSTTTILGLMVIGREGAGIARSAWPGPTITPLAWAVVAK